MQQHSLTAGRRAFQLLPPIANEFSHVVLCALEFLNLSPNGRSFSSVRLSTSWQGAPPLSRVQRALRLGFSLKGSGSHATSMNPGTGSRVKPVLIGLTPCENRHLQRDPNELLPEDELTHMESGLDKG